KKNTQAPESALNREPLARRGFQGAVARISSKNRDSERCVANTNFDRLDGTNPGRDSPVAHRELGTLKSKRACASAEIGPQARVGPGELFGKDPRLRDDGDEVGVAGPAGQDMHVNVVRHSGARGAADVEPEVEPVRVVLRL